MRETQRKQERHKKKKQSDLAFIIFKPSMKNYENLVLFVLREHLPLEFFPS